MRVEITSSAFDPLAALARFQDESVHAGALASFTGYCRGGDGIEWLELEHYPGFTENEIQRIAHEAVSCFALIDLLIIHRAGRIAPREAIVLVAALSAHRAGAFAAVERMMDYLKTDAPFWKREMRGAGAHWVEPTEEDRRRRAAHGRETT